MTKSSSVEQISCLTKILISAGHFAQRKIAKEFIIYHFNPKCDRKGLFEYGLIRVFGPHGVARCFLPPCQGAAAVYSTRTPSSVETEPCTAVLGSAKPSNHAIHIQKSYGKGKKKKKDFFDWRLTLVSSRMSCSSGDSAPVRAAPMSLR